MKIRALIVDDEQLARQRVRLLLGEEPDVEVIGESGDGFEAVDQIQATRPDLVFLDVQMPDMDGFEVLRRVPQALLPVVIFTTAYDQHALRAFEVNALDYLLKPFKPTRFKEAVQRARDLIANKHAGVAARSGATENSPYAELGIRDIFTSDPSRLLSSRLFCHANLGVHHYSAILKSKRGC